MATLFADGTLLAFTATYDPATRGATGGSNNAYPTLSAAFSAAATDDVIECRAGLVETLAGTLTVNKRVTIRRYNGEDSYINAGSFDADRVILATASGSTWAIDIRGGGSGTRRVFFVNGGAISATINMEINGCGGVPFRSAGTGVLTVQKLRIIDCEQPVLLTHTGASTYDNFYLQPLRNTNTTNQQGLMNISAGTHTFNSPVMVGGCSTITTVNGLVVSGATTTVTLNTPTIVGYGMDKTGTAGSKNYTIQASTGCTINVNGGIVNGHVMDPHGRVSTNSASTVNFSGVNVNGFARVPVVGKYPGVVSFACSDSNHAETGGNPSRSLDHYVRCFRAAGACFSYYPDDGDQMPVGSEKHTSISAFVAANHELGFQNPSSTSLLHDWALSLQLHASSTLSSCTLVISRNGELYTFLDGSTVLATVDTEQILSGTRAKYIGSETATGNDHLRYRLSQVSIGGQLLTANGSYSRYELNPWDDTPSTISKDGTYTVTKAAALEIPVDRDRWFMLDVVDGAATWAAGIGVNGFKTFGNHREATIGADGASRLAALGYVAAIGNNGNDGLTLPLFDSVAGDPMQLKCYKVYADIRGDDAGYQASPDMRARQWARAISSAAYSFGLWPIMMMDRVSDSAGTPAQHCMNPRFVQALVSEFSACGLETYPVEDAARRFITAKNGGTNPPHNIRRPVSA